MYGKTCFFIGHREASEKLLPFIQEAVERHIVECGVTDFIVGHYGGFDYLSAKAVIAAKEAHPKISLSLLLPYHPSEREIKLPDGFDCTYYPEGMECVPRRVAIARANRYVVERVNHLIAYAWHPASNARNLVEYAKRLEKKKRITVFNLADQF